MSFLITWSGVCICYKYLLQKCDPECFNRLLSFEDQASLLNALSAVVPTVADSDSITHDFVSVKDHRVKAISLFPLSLFSLGCSKNIS